MKILMVCLGNICRSPLAEGIMAQKARQKGLDWEIDSAGTGSWHTGERPDPRSIAEARRNGIDITYQRARQIKAHDLDHFDLILAMDQSNHQHLLDIASNVEQQQKVHLIMELAYPGKQESVPDPYWDNDGFGRVFQMLDDACERIIEKLYITDPAGQTGRRS